jgi:hypothetical protein
MGSDSIDSRQNKMRLVHHRRRRRPTGNSLKQENGLAATANLSHVNPLTNQSSLAPLID